MNIEKEKRDIEMLRKQSGLDITEVAYDKNGEICAWALREAPPSRTYNSGSWFGKGFAPPCAPR